MHHFEPAALARVVAGSPPTNSGARRSFHRPGAGAEALQTRLGTSFSQVRKRSGAGKQTAAAAIRRPSFASSLSSLAAAEWGLACPMAGPSVAGKFFGVDVVILDSGARQRGMQVLHHRRRPCDVVHRRVHILQKPREHRLVDHAGLTMPLAT